MVGKAFQLIDTMGIIGGVVVLSYLCLALPYFLLLCYIYILIDLLSNDPSGIGLSFVPLLRACKACSHAIQPARVDCI